MIIAGGPADRIAVPASTPQGPRRAHQTAGTVTSGRVLRLDGYIHNPGWVFR